MKRLKKALQPSPFCYDALPADGQSIRLFTINPNAGASTIAGKLGHTTLDAAKNQYIAASYTWGDPEPQCIIIVNERRFKVRKNVYDLLHTFRDRDKPVTLWIDSMCINQDSLEERNHQVNMMGAIYSRAREVYAWLGKLSPRTSHYVAAIEETARLVNERRWPLPRDIAGRADESMQALLSLRYWTRAWIVQELVLGFRVTFFVDQSSLKWQDVRSAMSMVSKEASSIVRAMDQAMCESHTFEALFEKFGHLDCAVDHDKFYSLYGMISRPLSVPLPMPNYSLCINEVFVQHANRCNGQGLIKFVILYLRHFPRFRKVQNICSCHAETSVEVHLRLQGTITKHNGDKGPLFSVFRENDIYRHRKFPAVANDCPAAGDLAFTLWAGGWYFVVRTDPKSSTPKCQVLGLVHHSSMGSEFRLLSTGWGDIQSGKNSECSPGGGVLAMKLNLALLFELAMLVASNDEIYTL